MTISTTPFLQRLESSKQLWSVVVPNTPAPPNATWVRWLAAFTDAEIERALLLVPHRFRDKKPYGDEQIYRFITTTLAELRNRRRNT